MPVTVTVIVVSHGTRELLESCLTSVIETARELDVELFVVDNASTDGSADMVATKFPQAVLIRNNENVGFAAANNKALDLARGDLVFLLNSDAAILPGCLQALANAFAVNPVVGVLGPKLLNTDSSLQPSWGVFPSHRTEFIFQSFLFKIWPGRFPWGRRVHPWLRREYESFHDVAWVTGAALAFRRDVYRAIGGMPEQVFMYGEDVEFCARANDAGFRVAYVPTARVIHHMQGSRRDHAGWIENYTRGMIDFYERRLPAAETLLAKRFIVAGSQFRTLLWSLVSLVAPGRRDEARRRREGYRRAIRLAREPAASRSHRSNEPD